MDSAPEDQYWVICPFCHQPNQPGRHICSHCWSLKLRSVEPVSTAEMQAIVKQCESQAKRRYTIKFASITSGSLILAMLLTFLILFAFTDVMYRPTLALNSSSPPGQWTMFRHDLLYSGASGTSETQPQGEVQWTFQTEGAIQSSPAVVNGIVYFGSRDAKLYALDSATGDKLWEYQADSWVETPPAVVDGIVYFGSNDGFLYTLDAATGQLLWSFETPYPVKTGPAVADGIVYFGSGNSNLYALEAATGRKLWQYEAESRVEAAPVVNNGIVYFSSGSFLYALDAHGGRMRLNFESYHLISSSPAVSDSTVYFGNTDGILYAIDGYARNWFMEHELKPYWISLWLLGLAPEPQPQSGSIWGIELGDTIYSSPAVVNGIAYLGVDNNIMAVDVNTQETLWSLATGDQIKSSPTLVGNTLYIGSNDGRFYAVDAATGQELWSIATEGPVASSAALADGILYFGSHDGKLYAVR